MATVQKEFEPGAALLELYKDLPYVKKLAYTIGDWGDHILVRAIIDAECSFEEFFARAMEASKRSGEFEDMLPSDLRSSYRVVPLVSDADEASLHHFGTMTAVIDR